jgi:hypothetical protein
VSKGKEPRIPLPDGWWPRLVLHCKEYSKVPDRGKAPLDIYEFTRISRRSFVNARGTNDMTEAMFIRLAENVGFSRPDDLLQALMPDAAIHRIASYPNADAKAGDPPESRGGVRVASGTTRPDAATYASVTGPEIMGLLGVLAETPKLQRAASNVLAHADYPRIMSLDDRLVPNPVWRADDTATSGRQPISDRLRGHMFLMVAEPPWGSPCLYCYWSERWGAYLLPFFKHLGPLDTSRSSASTLKAHVKARYQSTARKLGMQIVSVKRNQEHPDELWLYAFEFYNVVLKDDFKLGDGNRWLDLERLSDPHHREAAVNGDILRAIRSSYGTGLHGLKRSNVDFDRASFGDT